MFVIYLSALFATAWCTLLERKFLAGAQWRKGPNKVSWKGTLQPIADAVKLFGKERLRPSRVRVSPYIAAPPLSLTITLIVWHLWPFPARPQYFQYGLLIYFCLSSAHVYTILGAGWGSMCIYSSLGSMRGVGMVFSYEIPLVVFFLRFRVQLLTWDFSSIRTWHIAPIFLINIIVLPVFSALIIIELHRAPFDLVEAESELVSGYNTEYGSVGFVLLFLSEYGALVVGSQLVRYIVFWPLIWHVSVLFGLVLCSLVLIARAAFPRVKAERLVRDCWKSYLPLRLIHLTVTCIFCVL